MNTKLMRTAETAEKKPEEKFTSLAHLLSENSLKQCHKDLEGSKATGVDRTTKAMYDQDLQDNILKLVERLRKKWYRPQPA